MGSSPQGRLGCGPGLLTEGPQLGQQWVVGNEEDGPSVVSGPGDVQCLGRGTGRAEKGRRSKVRPGQDKDVMCRAECSDAAT